MRLVTRLAVYASSVVYIRMYLCVKVTGNGKDGIG